MTAFSQFSLRPELIERVAQLGFESLTPIQAACLPDTLAGEDIIAQAKTGSGKTVSFSLPMLNQVQLTERHVQAVVLCPTRELAEQVGEVARELGRGMANLKVLTVYGGEPIGLQIRSLKHGAHIIVGTPGRVHDLLRKQVLDVSLCHYLVLDEADRMLDMGFRDEMLSISEYLPQQRQTLLFSATYPDDVSAVSAQLQQAPKTIKLTETTVHSIRQRAYEVDNDQRWQGVANILSHFSPESAMVFCNTKRHCQALFEILSDMGWSVVALQGDMEQAERQRALVRFAQGSATVLVATDVAARGLDIAAVAMVINAELPTDTATYVHRIGRTGRAGASGEAVSLFDKQDEIQLARVEEAMEQSIARKHIQGVPLNRRAIQPAPYVTVMLNAGKRQKLRPGDFVGTLTQQAEIPVEDVGDIKVVAQQSFIAIKQRSVKRAMAHFREGRVKGKRVKAKKLND